MNAIEVVAQDDRVRSALESLEKEIQNTILNAISIQQIPAPTFSEALRADHVRAQMAELGLADVHKDNLHNVFGRLPGTKSGSPVVISAHLDTVFPEETDLSITYENGHKPGEGLIYGPGLADNSMGVAGILELARVLDQFELSNRSDIWIIGNTCEEGLGNLRGMKAVIDRFGPEALYIVIEGGSFGNVYHRAIGSKRFRIEVSTAGGHSWGDFGSPSAVHVLGHIISEIDNIPMDSLDDTTFNVGVVSGGTTINTIAAEAECLLDLRSTDATSLDNLVSLVEKLMQEADHKPGVRVKMSIIGDRPAGQIPNNAPIVDWATEALHHVGCADVLHIAGSTDANVPISMGIDGVCIGLANSGNTHRVDEFLDPSRLSQGICQLLLLCLAAAGYENEENH